MIGAWALLWLFSDLKGFLDRAIGAVQTFVVGYGLYNYSILSWFKTPVSYLRF